MDNKPRNLKIHLQDLCSDFYVKSTNFISFFYGSSVLKLKAAFFGVKLLGNVKCWGAIHIMRSPRSEITIGNNVVFVSSSPRCTATSIYAPVKLRTWSKTAKIIIEDNVGLNGTSISARSKTIKIGSASMIAPNVTIMDSDFHALWPPQNRASNPALEEDEDVLIGKNVWIGTQSILLKGTKIGDNSVIAAGSIVRGEIPPNVLAAGNPAKVIRSLS